MGRCRGSERADAATGLVLCVQRFPQTDRGAAWDASFRAIFCVRTGDGGLHGGDEPRAVAVSLVAAPGIEMVSQANGLPMFLLGYSAVFGVTGGTMFIILQQAVSLLVRTRTGLMVTCSAATRWGVSSPWDCRARGWINRWQARQISSSCEARHDLGPEPARSTSMGRSGHLLRWNGGNSVSKELGPAQICQRTPEGPLAEQPEGAQLTPVAGRRSPVGGASRRWVFHVGESSGNSGNSRAIA